MGALNAIKITKRFKGIFGEYLAMGYFMVKGYHVLHHSYKGKFAEVDLVLLKGNILCLAEVKYRKNKESAHYAIMPAQRERLLRQAQAFLDRYPASDLRLDAFLVNPSWPFIEHIVDIGH